MMGSTVAKKALGVLLSLKFSLVLWTIEVVLAASSGTYVNWKRLPNVGGPIELLFRPQNTGTEGEFLQSTDFRSGLAMLQDIVKQAEHDNKRIRAYGSKWSSTDVPYSNEYIVESWGLNYCQIGFNDTSHLDTGYQGISDHLAFVQAGVMIKYLNQALLDKGLALPTTGSSDGQRIVGATSTSAHGAAYQYGAMQEFIRGIHVILPDEHVFIQKNSDPVVTTDFVDYLGSGGRLVSNDAMFNAAVVSFGSFGLIHGLVIEAEPLYELRCQNYQLSYPEMEYVLTTLDLASLNLEGALNENPYHFTVHLNPYRLGASENGAFFSYCEKVFPITPTAFGANVRESLHRDASLLFAEELANHVTGGICSIGAFFNKLFYGNNIQGRLASSYAPFETPVTQYPSEWFTNSGSDAPMSTGPVIASMGIGVPLQRTVDALEVIVAVMNKYPLESAFEIRSVKKSNATLAYQPFGDVTTTISFTSVLNHCTFFILDKIQIAMYESGIPHSYHWGKYHPLNNKWITRSYGPALTEWQTQRNTLLGSNNLQYLFSNDWMEDVGLYIPTAAYGYDAEPPE